jgi:hypothetical protein
MPRTYRNQNFQNGTLQSENIVVLDDALFGADDARVRLKQVYAALNAWAADARTASAAEQAASDGWGAFTAGQKDTANKALHTRMAVMFDRLALFFDRFADILIDRGYDQ